MKKVYVKLKKTKSNIKNYRNKKKMQIKDDEVKLLSDQRR